MDNRKMIEVPTWLTWAFDLARRLLLEEETVYECKLCGKDVTKSQVKFHVHTNHPEAVRKMDAHRS